jgi:hypothetical protein
LQVAQGNLAEALQSYRDGFVIFNRLSEGDPSNAEWLRDLSVSFEQKLNALGMIGSQRAAWWPLSKAMLKRSNTPL